MSDSESEVHTAPSFEEKRKATATKSSSRKVHEPGTGELPENSDSDSEDEEEDDEDSEDSPPDLQDEEKSEAESILESNDEFEEGADGGFPAKVSKKSKKMCSKSPVDCLHKFSQKGRLGICGSIRFHQQKKASHEKSATHLRGANVFIGLYDRIRDKQRL